jgi:transposase
VTAVTELLRVGWATVGAIIDRVVGEARQHLTAYLLKEQLWQAIATKHDTATPLLEQWCAWASRSRIPAFVELARRIRARRLELLNGLVNGMSNAIVESSNTKLRVLTSIA